MGLRILISFGLACSAAFAASDTRVPVIVELFTSEGCSSCPPADAMLARLEHTQPVSGARVIALSEHVDYWNNLGWVDPFSSPQFRARQNDYARAFGVDSVYTPQMVINGRAQFVGDDLKRASSEIEQASKQPSAVIQLQPARNPKEHELIDLIVRVVDLPPIRVTAKKDGAPVQVLLAVTEDNLSSDVQHGENSGRRLRHVAVVRSFGLIGNLDPREKPTLSIRNTLKLSSNWKRQDLHAVVFLQERATQRILGAESVDLN
jgi:hypothetical protein